MKKISVNRLNYSLYLAILLSLITLTISIFSPIWGLRLVYITIDIFLINAAFLMTIGILSEDIYKKNPKRANKIFFLVTTFYTIIYIVISVVFIITLQTARIQTILFALRSSPIYLTIIILVLSILTIILISKGLQRIIELKESKRSKKKKIKTIIIISIFALLLFNSATFPKKSVEDEIVKTYNKGRPVLFEVAKYEGEELIKNTKDYKNFNVVFILLESVSTERVHSYGYSRNVTPNIDWFMQRGISFENAYTTATHSDYAQPAILSSNHIIENKYRNLFSEQKNQNAIWQILDKEGYNTYYFSSQDDSWVGMYNYFNFTSLNKYWSSKTNPNTKCGVIWEKRACDEETVNEAINSLNEEYLSCNDLNKKECTFKKEKPFFLYLNFQATHSPFIYPEGNSFYNEKTDKETNKFDNALKYVDNQVGKVKEYLTENDLIDETIVIISSDHGHDLYSRHSIPGHGLSVYDEETKVPLIFYLPGEDHQLIKERVGTINVLPTLLKIMNISEPKGLRGSVLRKNQRIFFYAQNHRYLIGMIEKDIKVIIDMNKNLVEVYDLKKDPEEKNNLYETNNHDKKILTLLLWHHCQLNYFSKDEKPKELERYCKLLEKS